MIEFATKQDTDSIISLWQEAFGDSREWVMSYLGRNINNVAVYKENGSVLGMLSLLPVSYKGKKGFYVYGVATSKNHRGKGISTELLEYAKSLIRPCDADFLVLVPRSEALFDFYKKRGFFAQACVKKRIFQRDRLKQFETGKKVHAVSAGDYFRLRKSTFPDLVEWSEDSLYSIREFENGEFYMTDDGSGAFAYSWDDTLYIKELCGSIGTAAAVNELAKKERIVVTEKSTSAPSCMTYPEFSEKIFFNISID